MLPDLNAAAVAVANGMHARLRANLPDTADALLAAWLAAAAGRMRDWQRLLLASDVAPQWFLRDPDGPFASLMAGRLQVAPHAANMTAALRGAVAEVASERELQRRLRFFRNQILSGIIWREATGRSTFAQTVTTLSDLADLCVQVGLETLESWAHAAWGRPEGDHPGLLVLGMGKLGGRELNLSSDIDLIFVYECDGQCQAPQPGSATPLGPVSRRGLTHREYYTRVGQRLCRLLDDVTEDGFVFRVDMRLRPFGSSGALAASLAALEDYYEDHGRDWERYALIKTRYMAGPELLFQEAVTLLDPFVYRRYLDFGVVASLRDMKQGIGAEARRRGSEEDDVKLGRGGIREAEFIVQALQLIHGGRQAKLREPSFTRALTEIQRLGLLSSEEADALRQAYVFLRNLEHRLQAKDDRQTQKWPRDLALRQRLAWSLGFSDADALHSAWQGHRTVVQRLFDALFSEIKSAGGKGEAIWLQSLDSEESLHDSLRLQAPNLLHCAQLLTDLRAKKKELPAISALRLDNVMPKLLDAVLDEQHPDLALRRTLPLIGSILRRSAYLSLLAETPQALIRLVHLGAASDWIATRITRLPALLDELLDDNHLTQAPERAALLEEANFYTTSDDLETSTEKLCQFKASHELRSAALDLMHILPLPSIGNYLSGIAEAILQAVLDLCWRKLCIQHTAAAEMAAPTMAIIGYGKLGGLELGYDSDLDLVFVYDRKAPKLAADNNAAPDSAFYHRLVRQLLQVLSTSTLSGKLYDIDTRLRPSGHSGTMVSSLHAMADYQRHTAWTWEHRALVRARPVAGSMPVGAEFAQLRQEILRLPRDDAKLRTEIEAMRGRIFKARMRRTKRPDAKGIEDENNAILQGEHRLDSKHCAGGLVDIEFISQYLVLRAAAEFPALAEHTDNLRILDAARAHGILPAASVDLLQRAYLELRGLLNNSVLNSESGAAIDPEILELRTATAALWRQLFHND